MPLLSIPCTYYFVFSQFIINTTSSLTYAWHQNQHLSQYHIVWLCFFTQPQSVDSQTAWSMELLNEFLHHECNLLAANFLNTVGASILSIYNFKYKTSDKIKRGNRKRNAVQEIITCAAHSWATEREWRSETQIHTSQVTFTLYQRTYIALDA